MNYSEDMVTSLLPIYYVSLTVGLASSLYQGAIGNRKFMMGRFHWIYHIGFLAFHLFIITETYLYKNATQKNSQFDKRIVLFVIYTSLFISLVVLICHHLFRFGIHKTLIEIYTLDKRMTNFGIQIDHNSVYKNNVAITIFLIITAIWFSVINRESTKLQEFYFLGLFILEYMFTMTMKSQFCVFNVLLKHRFLALDTKLKEVINSTKNITTKENKIILVKNVEKDNVDTINLSPTANQIITLSEFHSKLYNISKRINLYYSVQILLITGKYFVEITATLYFNLRKIYKDTEGENKFDFYAIAYFIWAVMNAFDLLILVYVSDSMCVAVSTTLPKIYTFFKSQQGVNILVNT